MLVKLRPARAPAHGDYAENFQQSLVDHRPHATGSFQRRPRRHEHIHLHGAFVKRRQKIPAQLTNGGEASRYRHDHGQQDRPRMQHAEANHAAANPLKPAKQHAVLVAVHNARIRQEPVRQHRGNRQGHDQRCDNRHDIGDA
jgi:hypothetical protein